MRWLIRGAPPESGRAPRGARGRLSPLCPSPEPPARLIGTVRGGEGPGARASGRSTQSVEKPVETAGRPPDKVRPVRHLIQFALCDSSVTGHAICVMGTRARGGCNPRHGSTLTPPVLHSQRRTTMRATLATVALLTLAAGAAAQESGEGRRRPAPSRRRRARKRPRRGPRSACSGTRTRSPRSTAPASRRSARGRACPATPPTASPTSTARARAATAGGYGWSAFWTNGYAARRPAPLRPYRRAIGENGDIFLLVPFLAPVGPVSGAFFGY
jgi:hypothetical protein